ncbi:hypothetical protein RZS28_15225 [Methylocapsa polymorpha]|uniref:Uncharacterized protein n=1 Tax=Methylocapsa polymorpha TaxID=3080828 RepID=A0ABZ0HPC3_9HYPH|nr:hypothetical protein RZS28_15225 [Methylocapsa sp. RX1]
MTNIRRLGELHVQTARTKAFRVFAFAGAVFPGEWSNLYIEAITQDLLEFAFHARRVNQICDLDTKKFSSIKVLPVVISENDPGNWVENYDWALNRLMHAREFEFGNCHSDHRILFPNAESNLIPLYVKVATDQRSMETISLFGLVNCFLCVVIPEVRRRFPNWLF